jgi:hypothetical protein
MFLLQFLQYTTYNINKTYIILTILNNAAYHSD